MAIVRVHNKPNVKRLSARLCNELIVLPGDLDKVVGLSRG